ncbi:MAG: PTS sugar transporter subunit IIC [Acholeplasmatales bacterium]|nr:MAG: PTS sugar transporter subunit IIC [Acholeplasmatales bacterium]
MEEEKTWRKALLQYFIKTLNGMAYGLFSTLIIGVIIRTIADLSGWEALREVALALMGLMGVGIGLGVAWSLNLTGLKLIAGAMAGGIATRLVAPDPVVAYLTSIAAIEVLRRGLKKPTPLDILLIPLIGASVSFAVVSVIGLPVATFMGWIGDFIQTATTLRPFLMGLIIAVVMGMALTAPISSAAIAISITLSGMAGGAAVVGGAAQMLGFAVMSRKDNPIGTVISIAIGTSMLQFKNVLKKPIIWLPPIIASAILGPLSTLFFKVETDASGAGMGTSALVGQIATIDAMGTGSGVIISIIILHIVLPIALVFGLDVLFRRTGLISLGDFSLKAGE